MSDWQLFLSTSSQSVSQSPWWCPAGVRPAADRLRRLLQPRSSWAEKLLVGPPSSPPGTDLCTRLRCPVSLPAGAARHQLSNGLFDGCHVQAGSGLCLPPSTATVPLNTFIHTFSVTVKLGFLGVHLRLRRDEFTANPYNKPILYFFI